MNYGRCHTSVRIIRNMMRLSQRWWSVYELANIEGVSPKTARRDIEAIEAIGAPVMEERDSSGDTGSPVLRYRIERGWLRQFGGPA